MRQLRAGIITLFLVSALLGATACEGGATAAVPWKNYPHLFSQPVTYKPLLVIMCKVSDNAVEPTGLMDLAKRFFTVGGSGTGNITDYYSDVSYGALSLASTKVIGWYTASFTTANLQDWSYLAGPGNRYKRVQLCADAVTDPDIDFNDYWGVIAITNILNDGGACFGDGKGPLTIHNQAYNLGCAVLDQNSLFTAFAGHEVGHVLGFVHSFRLPTVEYGDLWDIMSALATLQFGGGNYPSANAKPTDVYNGPGMAAPNLLLNGWIPPNRVATYHLYDAQTTITLTALSHPSGAHPLVAEIPGLDPNDFFTVEYRQRDGWDAGLPNDTVLIHEYKPKEVPWSYLVPSPYSGQWLAGQTWNGLSDSAIDLPVMVTVKSIDPDAGTATIVIGPSSAATTTPNPNIFGRIVKPTPEQKVTAIDGRVSLQLSAAIPSSGVGAGTIVIDPATTHFAWSDSLGLFTAAKQNATVTFAAPPGTTCGYHKDTITLRVTDSAGQSSISQVQISIEFTPCAAPQPTATPLPKPSVRILAPTSGQTITAVMFSAFRFQISSTASADVVSYAWSDSLGLFSDTKQNDTVALTAQSPLVCGNNSDTIKLKVTNQYNQTATATVLVTIAVTCIN
ncbi:MAG TPA: hypothetical protein VFQ25_07655 [Ktedonobacterales bacterium]|nr:hypothetical protein [Ktedonobacterales bacterium]